jgi:hypothetical protein
MKKDKLERFIRDNRSDFDVFEPSDTLWGKIGNRLPQESTTNQKVIKPLWTKVNWRIAAGILLVLGASIIIWQYQRGNSPDRLMSQVSPQEAQVVMQYASMIEQKREVLENLKVEDPVLYEQFAVELQKLDQEYQSLRKEFPETPNHEELIQAMVQNLQTQLGILNQQLQIIQEIKKAKQSHEQQI